MCLWLYGVSCASVGIHSDSIVLNRPGEKTLSEPLAISSRFERVAGWPNKWLLSKSNACWTDESSTELSSGMVLLVVVYAICSEAKTAGLMPDLPDSATVKSAHTDGPSSLDDGA